MASLYGRSDDSQSVILSPEMISGIRLWINAISSAASLVSIEKLGSFYAEDRMYSPAKYSFEDGLLNVYRVFVPSFFAHS